MPRQEFTSPEPKSDIYALLMVLSAVFVLAAIIITYVELAKDYDFGGESGGAAGMEAPVEPSPAATETPAETPAETSAE